MSRFPSCIGDRRRTSEVDISVPLAELHDGIDLAPAA